MSIPASRTLRWLAAGLVLAAAGLALALSFVSATLLTVAIGGVAIASGLSQLIRLTGAGDLRNRLFRGLSGLLYLESDNLWAIGTLLGIALGFSALNLLMTPLNSGD